MKPFLLRGQLLFCIFSRDGFQCWPGWSQSGKKEMPNLGLPKPGMTGFSHWPGALELAFHLSDSFKAYLKNHVTERWPVLVALVS